MKSLFIAALAFTVMASAVSVQAAERFDGKKFFAEQADRNTQ